MICPCCNGDGDIIDDYIEYWPIKYVCGYCKQKGRISLWAWLKYWYYTGERPWTQKKEHKG